MLIQSISNIKVKNILYYCFWLLDPFRFCEICFTTHPPFVANKSAISPFSGGCDVAYSNVYTSKDMTRADVCHDPFICATWLFHMCDVTHSNVCMPKDMTVWHDLCIFIGNAVFKKTLFCHERIAVQHKVNLYLVLQNTPKQWSQYLRRHDKYCRRKKVF